MPKSVVDGLESSTNVDTMEKLSYGYDKQLGDEPNTSNYELETLGEKGNEVLKLEKDEYLLPEVADIIGRQVLRNDGVYIEGKIEGLKVTLTADTGAARTVVSTRVYDKIPLCKRPKLIKSQSLASANGQPLVERGKAIFTLQIGDLVLEKELVVAEIEDEILLGLDILMKGEKGPADIKLSKGVVELNGATIPCVQIGQPETLRKVTAADQFIIPPKSEIIIDVFVDRTECDTSDSPKDFLIEPHPKFIERHPVVMASCLVDISNDVTSKVRLMNPFDFEVKINQDTVVGMAEKVETQPVVLLPYEKNEFDNFDRIRRIPLSEPDPITWETNTGIIRSISKKGTADGGKSGIVPPHLLNLYEEAANEHPLDQKQIIAELLRKYSNAFSAHDTDLGLTHLIEHSINTGNEKPTKLPPRRVPLAYADEEKNVITQLLDQGIIQRSNSPWSCPLLLIFKKSGKVRPCVDYRSLNAKTLKDAYPLPRIQDCLDSVAGATIFSTFDLTSGYHQIPVKDEDIPKTAFCTKYGLYEFKTMPFGVCNGPATCQRLMELVLKGLQWQICLIYLDDVIVYSKNFEDHINRLDMVLQRILVAGLKLKPEKCQLLKSQVNFLGHVVSKKGIEPNPENVSKILNLPTPKSVRDIRQVLGMGSYYRRHIKDFSILVKPLTELTKKNHKFIWTNECQNAFDKLKSAFTSTEIMAFPMDEGEFFLDTDASDFAIGAVLSQMQNGQQKVIAFGSRTLNKAEKNYCVTDKELLAVRYFVEYYRQYLLGRKFCVRTDHQALVWLFSFKEPKGRVARWLEILSPFDFTIEYRQGRKHSNADCMSRCQNPRDCDCNQFDNLEDLKCGPCKKCQKRAVDMESSLVKLSSFLSQKSSQNEQNFEQETHCTDIINKDPVCAVKTRLQTLTKDIWMPWNGGYSMSDLHDLQVKDFDIGPIFKWKESGQRPLSRDVEQNSAATRHYWYIWDSLTIKEGLLYKKVPKSEYVDEKLQLIVPFKLKDEILKNFHCSLISGHLGRKKTKAKLGQRYYWFEMKEDVNVFVSQCNTCEANKTPQKLPRAPLGLMNVGAPLDRLGVDIMGPLPETPRGNKYILSVTDHFTKWVEIFAVPNQTAVTCAQEILNEVICRYGCPLAILTDQGRNFESEVFQQLCTLLEIRKTRTSPRNPKCNGQTERFNRTILPMIKSYLRGEQTNWDLNLGCLAGAYRASPNETTGFTPNLLMLGREIRLPFDLTNDGQCATLVDEPHTYGDHAHIIRERLQKAHAVARKHLYVNVQRRKDQYDVKTKLIKYKMYDKVWIKNENRKEKECPKLNPLYIGPCIVTQRFNDLNYQVQIDGNGTQKVLNHDKLKPYLGKTVPKWMKRLETRLKMPVSLQT